MNKLYRIMFLSFFVALSGWGSDLSAQQVDTIITKSEKYIPALFLKVDRESGFVTYKDPAFSDGIDLSIRISKIKGIKYADGRYVPEAISAAVLPVPEIEVLSPASGIINEKTLKLSAKILNVSDPNRIKVLIDDRSVDFKFDNKTKLLTATIRKLTLGKHLLKITASNDDGPAEAILNITYSDSDQQMDVIRADVAPSLTIGLKVGASQSGYLFMVNGEDASGNTDGKIGLSAGIQIEKAMSNSFLLRLEGLYTQRGYTSKVVAADLSANHVDVNLLGVVKFGSSQKLNPFVTIGAAYSRLISGEANLLGEEVAVTFEQNDLGLTAGAGVYINQRIILEARYVHGLQNIESKHDITLADEQTLSRNIFVGLSYLFGR